MRSKSLQDLPIVCAVCSKKTKYYNTYIKLAKKHAGL
jgi:hypothetical protein